MFPKDRVVMVLLRVRITAKKVVSTFVAIIFLLIFLMCTNDGRYAICI